MLHSGSYPVVVAAISIALIAEGSTQAVQPSLMGEQYHAAIRYSGVSVAYQFATVIWSGPTPILAALLVGWAGGYWPLAAYIVAAAVISVLGIAPLREAAGQPLGAVEIAPADADDRQRARVPA